MVEQGANQGLALAGRSLTQAVKQGNQLIAQAKRLPGDGFHFRTEGPGFLVSGPQVAVVAKKGREGSKLKPTDEELRRGVAQKSSDIAATERDSAERKVQEHGHRVAKVIPVGRGVPRPDDGVPLDASIARSGDHEGTLVGPMA